MRKYYEVKEAFLYIQTSQTSPNLGSVDQLFRFIIINSIYFQKWVRFTEEILQKMEQNQAIC